MILKRRSNYMFGLWQQVSGKVEQGETGSLAILREIEEETGNWPKKLYSADIIESFYDMLHNCIHLVPVFAAEIEARNRVVLSAEHTEFKWVTAAEAKRYLVFSQQKMSIDVIEREFILKKPPRELEIEF